jgi:hypothetical protein
MATWSGKHAAKLGDSVTLAGGDRFHQQDRRRPPWVVNLSMGRHGEQHDGTTLVEQGLDAALRAAPGRAICQSAGNYFIGRFTLRGSCARRKADARLGSRRGGRDGEQAGDLVFVA